MNELNLDGGPECDRDQSERFNPAVGAGYAPSPRLRNAALRHFLLPVLLPA